MLVDFAPELFFGDSPNHNLLTCMTMNPTKPSHWLESDALLQLHRTFNVGRASPDEAEFHKISQGATSASNQVTASGPMWLSHNAPPERV